MEFPKKSCPAGRKRVTLGRFRNAILKEKLQMNMKNIIKNKQKELMQGMIALILCVALFCSAAVSGKNDGSEWKMRHGGQKYEETGTDGRVQTPLYAGIHAYCLRTRRGTGAYSDGGHLSDGEGGAFAGSQHGDHFWRRQRGVTEGSGEYGQSYDQPAGSGRCIRENGQGRGGERTGRSRYSGYGSRCGNA